jgi:hypothetical protein
MKGIKTLGVITTIIVVVLLATNYFITKDVNKGRLAHLREIVAEEALGTKEHIMLGLKDLNNKKNEKVFIVSDI